MTSMGEEGQAGNDFSPSGPASTTARSWAVVVIAFFAVLALAGFLFDRHRRLREADIVEQLARDAARLGREVELKVENYRQVVDNVTRITGAAGIAGVRAESARADAKERREIREKQIELLDARNELVENLRRNHPQAVAGTRGLWEAFENAETEERAELGRAEEKDGAYAARADALLAALTELESAAAGVTRAQQPENPSGSDELERAKVGPARAKVTELERELTKAEQDANDPWRTLEAKCRAADVAWEKALSAAREKLPPGVDASKAGLTLDHVASDEARASIRGKADELSQPAALHLRSVARLVLPSHRVALRQACGNEANVTLAMLCMARTIAKRNDVTGLKMAPCPGTAPFPLVSEDGKSLFVPPSREASGGESTAVCGRVEVDELLSQRARTSEALDFGYGSFETVLLLHRDTATFHSTAPESNLRILALPGVESKQGQASNVVPDLALGAGKYRAFLQPIPVRVVPQVGASSGSAAAEQAPLVLVGLVREDRLSKASLELSLPSYLWVLLFLELGILSLPLAKLWLLGPTSRFRRFDVTVLVTSALLLALFSGVLVLGFLAHNRLARRADLQLEDVGREIESRAIERISRSARLLSQVLESPRGKKATEFVTLGNDPPNDVEAQKKVCESAKGQLAEKISFGGEHEGAVCEFTGFEIPGFSGEPEWRSITLLNKLGLQSVKMAPGEHIATPISVSDRDYFQRASVERTFCLDTGPHCTSGVTEILRSRTSGSLLLMVAKPIAESAPTAPLGKKSSSEPTVRNVAAIASVLDAYQQVVLPLGFQAAVIDEDGKILIHSDNEAHQGQSFFGEVGNQKDVRAALAARVSDTFDVRYLGESSRINVQPIRLAGTGWYAVTIAPKSIVDMATIDMVLATLFSFGCLLTLALLVVLAVFFLRWLMRSVRGKRPSAKPSLVLGLRPHGAYSRHYAKAGIRLLGCTVIVWVGAVLTSGRLPTTVGLVIALVLAAPWLGFSPGNETPSSAARGDDWRDRLPLTYPLYVSGIVGALVLAPSAVLFAGAYDHVVDNLVRAEQDHYVRALSSTPACLDRALPRERARSDCAQAFWSGQERPGEERDGPRTKAVAPNAFLTPIPYLADYLPPVGTSDTPSVGRLYLAETRAALEPAPSEFASVRRGNELALLATTGGARPRFVTALPALASFEYQSFHLFALALASLAALLIAGWVTFRSLDRLFFLRVFVEPKERKTETVQDVPGRKLLVLSPSEAEATVSRWWLECTPDERRTLAQLALDGYANPHESNVPVLKRLAANGLLDSDTLTIRVPELAEYARQAITTEDRRQWETADRQTAWAALRVPLSTGVLALLAAVTVSKPELGVASALVPTLAAGLPSVIKTLMGMVAPKALA